MMESKKTLCFEVTGQKLAKKSGFSGLVKGTKGYLQAEFKCSDEWKGCKKAAVFGVTQYPGLEIAAPVIGGKCDIPDEVAEKAVFTVRLIGVKEGYRIVSDTVEVVQK